MDYRYHVDVDRDYGSYERNTVLKFENGELLEALNSIRRQAEGLVKGKNDAISWSVTLYDSDMCDIKCKVDSTDFE